jgi:hypothetical protein
MEFLDTTPLWITLTLTHVLVLAIGVFIGYSLKVRNLGQESSKVQKFIVTFLLVVVYIGSLIAGIVLDTYSTPLPLHIIVMGVLGVLFEIDIIGYLPFNSNKK